VSLTRLISKLRPKILALIRAISRLAKTQVFSRQHSTLFLGIKYHPVFVKDTQSKLWGVGCGV